MTLADYLEKHEISDAAFAKRTGLARNVVWAYRKREREPRAAHVAVIERATQNKVRAKDLTRAA